MRFKTSLALCLVGITLSLCSVVQAGPVPSAIRAQYAFEKASIDKGDLKGWAKVMSEDFVSVDSKGVETKRADELTMVHELFKGAKKSTLDIHLRGATKHGDIVEVSFVLDGKIVGPAGTTTFKEVGVDSWKKVGKVWLNFRTVDKVFDIKAPKAK